MQNYVTARDIVIRAGTPVYVEPKGMRRTIYCPHATVTVGVTKDHTSEWTMPLDEALELGIVTPATEAQGA